MTQGAPGHASQGAAAALVAVALRVVPLAAAVALCCSVGAGASDRDDARLAAQVDAYLAPYVAGGNFSGVVLLAREGRVIVEHGYGMANYELGTANTPQTRFHIASVSKAFTAAAVLLLERQGRLRTTDPISRWVPDLPNAGRITLQHLLTHTSGIPDINRAPFYEQESRKPHAPADLVGLIRGLPPAFAPGERYEYSNSNYNVLAFVIEQVSGQGYGDFLRHAIFAPLGMADTGHDGDAQSLVPNRASGYVPVGLRGFGNAPWLDWSVKTGNGSLYSTAADLLRFDQALYADTLLPKGVLDKALAGGRGNVYGWFVGERFGHRRMGANGRSPGFTACLDRYPDDQVTVIVLANTYGTASQAPIAVDLAALALGRPLPAPARVEPIALGAEVLAPYAGRYAGGQDFFFPGTTLTVTARDGHLLMHWSSGADSILAPVAADEFLDRTFWARVRFERDASGSPSKLLWTYDDRDYPAPRVREP